MANNAADDVNLSYETHSAEETIAAGQFITAAMQPSIAEGLVLILTGDLGAGKTTLVKGIAAGLNAADAEDVTSPTFTLVHQYEGAGQTRIYHLDLYRLEQENQLAQLGIDEMYAPDTLVLIEWGKKFPSLKSHAHGEISIEHRGGDDRRIRAHWRPPLRNPDVRIP